MGNRAPSGVKFDLRFGIGLTSFKLSFKTVGLDSIAILSPHVIASIVGMDIVKRVTPSSPVNVTSSILVSSALHMTHVPPATTVKMMVYVSMMRTKCRDASVESASKGTSAKRKFKILIMLKPSRRWRRVKMIHLIILYKKVNYSLYPIYGLYGPISVRIGVPVCWASYCKF